MKKFIILLTVLSMVVVLFSCKVSEEESSSPTDPDIISLTVTSPTSNEVLNAISVYDIRWTSNTTQRLIIEYTIDNGQNWVLIASEVDNTGSHIWAPVPNTLTSTGRIRITTADAALSSTSEGFFSIVQGSEKSLIVLEPNGGEQWDGNSIQIIKWISSGVDSVTLQYTIDNGLNWITIALKEPSTGFYNWNPIPNTPSTNAKVKIKDTDDGSASDESNSTFTIEPADLISLTSPNGGEQWLGGSSQYIMWNTLMDAESSISLPTSENELGSNIKLLKGGEGIIESNASINSVNSIEAIYDVKIEYSVNGAASWNTIVESTPNNGIYFWSSIPIENSANCLIRVSNVLEGVPFDVNDEVFSIFATLPQEITIIQPNGGEAWAAGTAQDIKWSSMGVSSVKIEYTTNNGVDWTTIVESTQSDGFYSWGQLPSGAASNCRLKISDATDATPSDFSDELFSITPEPSIDLTSPNGGETLQSGSSINITWTSENIAKIKIEYSINNGAEWLLIADSIESTGYYTWENIPDVNSNNVRIKISDADDGAPSDMSDNILAISNKIVQILQVTSPNGGEVWEAGAQQNITWEANAIANVDIEYTDGSSVIPIVTMLPSTGAYQWTVPSELNSPQSKIIIKDSDDGSPKDESDLFFTIAPKPEISSIVTPASGSVYSVSEEVTIEWISTGIQNVGIKYTTTNGIGTFEEPDYYPITTKTGNTGTFKHKFAIPSTKCFVVVYDAGQSGAQSQSGTFTVADIGVSGYPASIHLVSTSLPSIGIKGGGDPETVNLIFEVQDSNAVPVDKDHLTDVTFSLELGTGGGEYLSPITGQTDAFGRVTVSLSSGTIAGPVRVKASLNSNGTIVESAPVPMSIHGGWPDANHFSVALPKLNYPLLGVLGAEIVVTALVGDEYTNPVKPNTTVYFSTDAGVIEGSGFTDLLGLATSTLVSGAPYPNDPVDGPGYFYVYANTIDKTSVNIETKTLRLFSGFPTINIIPNNINVPDGGSQSFTYTVADGNNNPLSEGSKYSVSFKSEGEVDINGQTDIEMGDVLFGNTSFGFTLYDTEADSVNTMPISIKVNVTGPNGKTSASIFGITN